MTWLFLFAVALIIYLALKFARRQPRSTANRSANRVFYMQVHGIRHHNADGTSRQKIIETCREGEELFLVPEPDNRFDAGAVRVCRKNGQQLGYWPADGRIASDLAAGWTYRVTIDEIYTFTEDRRKHGVSMRVEVLTMSRKTEARKRKGLHLP